MQPGRSQVDYPVEAGNSKVRALISYPAVTGRSKVRTLWVTLCDRVTRLCVGPGPG